MKSNPIIVSVAVIILSMSAGMNVAAQNEEGEVLISDHEEYLIPVRPGKPGDAPFWNQTAHQFMYAPSFDFKEIKGASNYRFTVQASNGQPYTFDADKPYATLEPIWLKIPAGPLRLKVEAVNSKGKVLKVSWGMSTLHYRLFSNFMV